MNPAGYMYKLITHTAIDSDYYSVGVCGAEISPNFMNYVPFWKHNGYWFFDSPEIMDELAKENGVDLSKMKLFYYEIYEFEFCRTSDDEIETVQIQHDRSFPTTIRTPTDKLLAGYDVVQYAAKNAPECSLLSCSGLSKNFKLNTHCLFEEFLTAKISAESGIFHSVEPGPYRIVAVYLCD